MSRLLDSSVILASLDAGEPHHAACAAVLLAGDNRIHVHALAEVFSTLTGGGHRPRVAAEVVHQLLRDSVLPFVKSVGLTDRDLLAGLAQAQARGVRGGAVYDYLHLVAARKAGCEALVTLDGRNFDALARPGDPRIETP